MALPTFDYRNALESVVGRDGISLKALDERAGLVALDAFKKRVDSGAIGFPNLADDKRTASEIVRYAKSVAGSYDDVLLVGIGGSALGPYALDVAMRGPHPVQLPIGGNRKTKESVRPRLVVLDNVDPGFIAAALQRLNPKRTLVCAITKSGSTAESLSTLMIVREWLGKGRNAAKQVVAITDPQKGDLLKIARAEGYQLFYVPENIGGRFSIFCPVGLVPAALIGIDIGKLLRGARDANSACWSRSLGQNHTLASALLHHALDTQKGKHIEVVFAYSQYLWGAAFWYRQLWAESLGKRVNRAGAVVETGQTPVAALGVTDQHSQVQLYMEGPRDKMLTFWQVTKRRTDLKIPRVFTEYDGCKYLAGKSMGSLFDAECLATQTALAEAGRPNCRWTLARVDEYSIGAFFQMMEFQTAFCGELYGVDAFDQPGVELAKKLTYGLMGRKGYEEYADRVTSATAGGAH